MRKKDVTIHLCVDYCKLNDGTHKDIYLLLIINDILEALQVEKYICSIDLASGYWQIKVVEKESENTGFGSYLSLQGF